MDHVEKDSENSGSFCSDNTDALLNASFKDLEDNESLVGSYQSPNREMAAEIEKHQRHVNNKVDFPMPSTTSGPPDSQTPEALYARNGGSKFFYQNEGNELACEIQSRNSIQRSNSFNLDRKHEQGLYSKVESFKNDTSHMQQKFSSNYDTTPNGRQSVIKLHTSLPSLTSDSSAKASNFYHNRKLYVSSEEQNQESLMNVRNAAFQQNSESTAQTDLRYQAKQTTVNGPFSLWQTASLLENSQRMGDDVHHRAITVDPYSGNFQDMSTQRNLRNSHGAVGAGESRHDNEGHSGTNQRDFHSSSSTMRGNNVLESATEEGQDEEMLLGLRHDPETDGK